MIKNLLLPLLLLTCTVSLKAQYILNGGFEDSTITVTDTLPTHWTMDYFGAKLTPDAHSGDKAVSIWNWYSYAPGWLVYGVGDLFSDGGGLPISINPDMLTGYYKYIYDDNGGEADSALCTIMIYSHQNFTGARDTIANVTYKFGPAQDWTAFTIPIDYEQPAPIADSIIIRFRSSESGFCTPSNECLYFYVDDLEVSTITGVHQSIDVAPSTLLFPSPSADGFRIQSDDPKLFPCELKLMDFLGRTVFSTTIDRPMGENLHPQLPAGNYVWEILGANQKRYSGKWSAQ
jgi:hypothetical protein